MTSSNNFQWRRDRTAWACGNTRQGGRRRLRPFAGGPAVGTARTWIPPWALTPSWPAKRPWSKAGVTIDQVDGIVCCDSHIAGGSGGSASQWAPRPYFDPPYDSEYG